MRLAALSCRSVDHATRPWSTTRLLAQRRERPGCNPVFQNIGVTGSRQPPVVEQLLLMQLGPSEDKRSCRRPSVASIASSGSIRIFALPSA
jgi:hypothetical protein